MRSKFSVPCSVGALFSLTIPCLISLCLSVAAPKAASSHTWHVKNDLTGDWETIQIAIDYATSGDTILVGPGTYNENLVIDGKELVLKSDSGPASTILDGSLVPASVIFCTGGLTNDTAIEGFTITNGAGTDLPGGARIGGGICCRNAAPIIRANIIKNNRAEDIPPDPTSSSSRGGGISFSGFAASLPSIVIEDNVIEQNFAFANGGGINIVDRCIIRHNYIQGNWTGHGDGGGLYYLTGPGPILIMGNRITENIAADHGGALYVSNRSLNSVYDLEITGNIMIGNQANTIANDCAGGAIYSDGGAIMTSNTISFNTAASIVFPPAGGICLWRPRAGTLIDRNIIEGNSEGGVVARLGQGTFVVMLRHNILFDNGDINVAADDQIVNAVENILADALFCSSGSTSTGELAQNSPALGSAYGVIGAMDTPGCGPVVPVIPTTWGHLKTIFGEKRVLILTRTKEKTKR